MAKTLIYIATLWMLVAHPAAIGGTLGGQNTTTIFLGVISARGVDLTYRRFNPLADYFSDAINTPVEVVPLEHHNNLAYLRDGKIDFLLTNPTICAGIVETLDVQLLANLNTNSGDQFGGVIISKAGSGITTLEDIKHKRVLAYKLRKSAGGHIFQSYHLKINGIDEQADLKWLRTAKTQDFIVEAIRRGHADVGFIRTGILESMAKENKIEMREFHIVDQAKDSTFPQVHTTALYPEWCLIAGPGNTDSINASFKHAAMSITPNMPVAQDAKIMGFVEPLDLAPLIQVHRTLGIPPFNHSMPTQ